MDPQQRTYVGQSSNIPNRIGQHISSGRVTNMSQIKVIEILGGKFPREVAEQIRIDQLGGIGQLANKVNPIGMARRSLFNAFTANLPSNWPSNLMR